MSEGQIELERKSKKAEYMKEYWKKNRAKNNEARKRWLKAHPEKAREINAKNQQRWRENNREKYNAYMREYRARQKAMGEIGQ